jgi:hypothetical protein
MSETGVFSVSFRILMSDSRTCNNDLLEVVGILLRLFRKPTRSGALVSMPHLSRKTFLFDESGKETARSSGIAPVFLAKDLGHHFLLPPDKHGIHCIGKHRQEKNDPGIENQGYAQKGKERSPGIHRVSYEAKRSRCTEPVVMPPGTDDFHTPGMPADPYGDQYKPDDLGQHWIPGYFHVMGHSI